MKHAFTQKIHDILDMQFGNLAEQIYKHSELIQYLNIKTKSANKGSKSRGSFGNIYAIYVLVEDYINQGFHINDKNYNDYDGAKFSDLLTKQRTLPFGAKLQNHALNHRLNEEFKKHFPTCDYQPIIRDSSTNRYWINPNLIAPKIHHKTINLAEVIIEIINTYIQVKTQSFDKFISTIESLKSVKSNNNPDIKSFVLSLIEPNVDARIFEIVSYAILKHSYKNQSIFWGWSEEELTQEPLTLYKTGRTNANDGGIDFVMKPLGRFFQVTETTDVKKYFLDIDKLEKYPVTFVVKSAKSVNLLLTEIKQGAKEQYGITKIIDKYMNCIEEIINIDNLIEQLNKISDNNELNHVLDEILIQSKVEFNYND